MKLCFIADARSPIAKNWINYLVEVGHEIHVISSYPCPPDVLPGAAVYQVPIALAGFSRIRHTGTVRPGEDRPIHTRVLASLRSGPLSDLTSAIRHWLAPLELHRHIQKVMDLIGRISPDLVHALRIPFEGILASKATPSEFPLLVSVWGNDFTLFANRNPLIGWLTRQAMRRSDALHCDCQRDLDLAKTWGFMPWKPTIVVPGAGGIQMRLFRPGPCSSTLRKQLRISADTPVIINPRGFRGYVRNDTFFQAIPIVLKERHESIFICSGMQGNPIAEKWVDRLAINENVRLLPLVPYEQMPDLFRLAEVTVSPSEHDGTPNTLLEAMGCGCFPVAGDIESIREWITHGVNGLLCDPTDPESLAQAILQALNDSQLCQRARQYNVKLIAERAEYGKVMAQAEQFYHQVIEHTLSKRKHS